MMNKQELHEYLPRDKHDLERADKLIALGYPEVTPILPEILEWMEDGNWPVSHKLGPFLASIGAPLAEDIRRILRTQNFDWHYWVLLRVVADSQELISALHEDLLEFRDAPSVNEYHDEVKEIVNDIIAPKS